MEIRKLTPEDLEEFREIQKAYIHQEWSPREFHEKYEKNRDDLVLEGIAVLDSCWRSGIGTRMLESLEEEARKKGKKSVSVGSAEGWVEKFYLANGYKPTELVVLGPGEKELERTSIKNYEEGCQKREKLRKKYGDRAREIIFIFSKRL